jgi:hypothetical protein
MNQSEIDRQLSRMRHVKVVSIKFSDAEVEGLRTLVQGNEKALCNAFKAPKPSEDAVLQKMLEFATLRSISMELFLVNFLDPRILTTYCSTRLGKSGNGTVLTIASRIVHSWSKPNFKALPLRKEGDFAEGAHAKKAQPSRHRKSKGTLAPLLDTVDSLLVRPWCRKWSIRSTMTLIITFFANVLL